MVDELTVARARALVASGALSARELVEAVLARLEETEPVVHAYVAVDGDAALAAAASAPRGPLHGIPFGAKDVFWARGFAAEAGSRVFAGFRPEEDAFAVRRLREAGAVLLGKHVTHELACGQDVPPTRNAWNASHYPGGSSAGAGASVAVGSSLAALGTDAGGSVRKPAALNSVVGLKPTFDLVSRFGVLPPSGSLDHVGVVARTVEDCALLLEALTGKPLPVVPPGVGGLRIGLPGYFFDARLDPEVGALVEAALSVLERAGARLVPVSLPSLELALPAGFTILVAEGGVSHRRLLRERPHDYGAATRRLLELGALLPAAHVDAAQRARSLICREVADAFRGERLDALAGPTLPRTSLPVDEMVIPVDLPRFIPYTFVANLTGLPALTVPCGFTAAGLPAGLHLIGRPFDEGTIVRVGRACQQETTWHERRPRRTFATVS